ncbi:SusC/RagA family TonB-linked outer membrane protein [Salisaeta longa]|uniref:SusC/RagA family TonB-linked outer membrane protein n=1 Tax=Salisaeta longa TaxID=503170 RepID=UPI0003B4F980|nr:SusC/RagA family TonB-linked outer membrane protein [Salisaeta longa]
MNYRYRLSAALALMVLLAAVSVTGAYAQRTVSGTVTDAQGGDALPGVNVRVEGTTTGTITGPQGTYELQVPAGPQTLVFSFIGYQTREVTIGPDQTDADAQLREDVVGLSEVIVTGLAASVKRENAATSIESISGEDLAGTTSVETLDGALSGKVAGAQISSYSGAPGGGMSIKLRGVSTINGNSDPLFIVDGVIVSNAAIPTNVNAVTQAAAGGSRSNQDNPVNRIADLNPRDIASIEILKGPSAAAIYGGKAANGVVLITTKMGQAGQTRVNFSQSVGITTIRHKLGMRDFNAQEAETAFGARGRDLFEQANGQTYDYEEAIFGQEGLLSRSQLSVSGGSQNTRFYISGLWQDDEGIVERTGYEKQSVRANVTHDFGTKATLTGRFNYINSTTRRGLTGNDNTGTTFGVSLTATPEFVNLFPNNEGIYPDHPFNASNPLQTIQLMTNEEQVNRIISSGRFEYNVFSTETQTLQAIVEGGVDFFSFENVGLFPRILQFERQSAQPGTSILGKTNSLNTNLRLLANHTLTQNDFTFTTQGGLIGANSDLDFANLVAENLIPGQQNITQAASLAGDQLRTFQKDRSFFVQENINWADRIIVTGGLRGDRSSLNGDPNKFYLYPHASLAVRIANFDFWSVGAVDQLKLRAAFGQTGNNASFGTKFTSFNATNIGGNVGTIIDLQRGASNIKPERQTEIEAGFDIAAFNRRARLSVTGYRKEISDQLLQREIPSSTGFRLETINGGTLINRGIETSLTLALAQSEAFTWESTTSFWMNRAEVTELPVPSFRATGGGFGATLGEIRIEEGKSPTQIVGIDDTDGDGVSDGIFQLGDAAPDFQMSFSNNITFFENLRLSFLAHWKKGGDNLNLSELLFDLSRTTPDFDADYDGDGVRAGVERLALFGVSARQFVQDASYFRLREIGLYYDLPQALLDRFTNGTLRRLSVGVSADNILTITPYDSYDPEVNNFGATPVATGVEVTPYPASKQFFFHLNVGL